MFLLEGKSEALESQPGHITLGTFPWSSVGFPKSQVPFWPQNEVATLKYLIWTHRNEWSFFLSTFLTTEERIKLSLSFHSYPLMSTLLKTGPLFILFTQCSALGPLRCLLDTWGRNTCSFSKAGICRKGNVRLFGYQGCRDLDT